MERLACAPSGGAPSLEPVLPGQNEHFVGVCVANCVTHPAQAFARNRRIDRGRTMMIGVTAITSVSPSVDYVL